VSTLVDIFTLVLLICTSALCIALIVFLTKITKSISEINLSMHEISDKAKPMLDQTVELTDKLNFIANNAKDQVDVVKDMINNVKEHVDDILTFEERILHNVEGPVSDVAKNFSAVLYGVNTFWNTYKRKRKNKN
jgi:uncharacterized protein YoxC